MDPCEPCKFRNKDAKAAKFCVTCQEPQCKTCAEIHKSSKATRNHLLVQYDELNKESEINQDLISFQRCNDHPGKQAEFYCIDHKHTLCSTCLLNIQNLKCKDVVEVESAGEQIVKCKLNNQLRTDLENTIAYCKAGVEKVHNIKESYKSKRQEIQKRIDNLKEKLMTAFNKYEKEIFEKMDANAEEQAIALSKAQDTFKKAMKTAEEKKNILQIVTDNGSKADVFHCALSIVKQSSDIRIEENALTAKLFTHSVQLSPEFATLLESIEVSPVFKCETSTITETFGQSFSCKSNIDVFFEIVKQASLEKNENISNDCACASADAEAENVDGRLFQISKNDKEHLTDKNKSAEAAKDTKTQSMIHIVPAGGITISVPGGKIPEVVDAVTLNDGCLVLSDQKWFRLIRLKEDLLHKDAAELSQKPGNITVLNDNFIVVCLPAANRVAFCSVEGEIRWTRNLKTKYSPRGIQAIDSKHLLVSMVDTNTNKWLLQVLTTDGALIENIGGSRSILDAERISSMKSSKIPFRLYLQCCKKSNTLYCFEANGKDVFSNAVISPNGLFVDNTGQIYILGSYGKLHVLSHNGTVLRTVDIPSGASGITCNRKEDTLFITRAASSVVSVFKVMR